MMRKMVVSGLLLVLVLGLGGIVFGEKEVRGDYQHQIDNFFSQIKAGKVTAAVDFIYSDNPWMSQSTDAIQNVKNQLTNLDKLVGKYQSHKKLLEKEVAGRFVYLYYFVAYERQPLRFVFEYYKPSDKWMLYSFSFDADIDEEIEASAERELFK